VGEDRFPIAALIRQEPVPPSIVSVTFLDIGGLELISELNSGNSINELDEISEYLVEFRSSGELS